MLPIKHFIAVLYDRTAVHFEPEYSSHIGRPDHGAFPGFRIQILTGRIFLYAVSEKVFRMAAPEPIGKTDSLKSGVEGPFGHRFICQGGEDFIGFHPVSGLRRRDRTPEPVRRLWILRRAVFRNDLTQHIYIRRFWRCQYR